MGPLTITDGRSGALIADHARLCDSMVSRFCGLMLRSSLNAGEGIVLAPCGSVHMALMRFSIDVVYLDRAGRAVKLVSNLRPYQVSFGGRRAHAAIEIVAGTLAHLDVQVGDEILVRNEVGETVRV